ncbi:uncharacterized protein LOC100376969 [Saccoglossus kowalevskii]|uniref:Hyphally regulated cell wall protein 3-like n=1 Tax=Saccoglossus kowalevskii TaxID=10224 RepID=A0ABM0GPT6_SACKO|nr:PREDICTED: hyphally regulated cell wall protein 3-like [Saccoglossus kowalevskii]
MDVLLSTVRLPGHGGWILCILLYNLSALCSCQDAFTPDASGGSNSTINDDISLALIIVAVVLLATFLCVCCAACRNSLCPDEQTDSEAATDTPDTPNLLSYEIEINDMIPPTYSNLVAEGIIGEEIVIDNSGRTNTRPIANELDPVTPPPNYDVVFKPSWPRSASAYVLHPERIEEVAMADLYTRQNSQERTARSQNSINRSVSFVDATPEETEPDSVEIPTSETTDGQTPRAIFERESISSTTVHSPSSQVSNSVSESGNENSQGLSPVSESQPTQRTVIENENNDINEAT